MQCQYSVLHFATWLLLCANLDTNTWGASPLERRTVLDNFRKLAANIQYIPDDISLLSAGRDEKPPTNIQDATALRALIRQAHLLPVDILKSDSPRERSHACVIFGYSERTDGITAMAGLIDDYGRGIPVLSGSENFTDRPRDEQKRVGQPAAVNNWAITALGRRFDPNCLMNEPKEFIDWWMQIEQPNLLPSHWMMLYKRTEAWDEPLDGLRERVLKLPSPIREIVMIAARREREGSGTNKIAPLFTDEAILFHLRNLPIQDRRLLAARNETLPNKLGDKELFASGSVNREGLQWLRHFMLVEHPRQLLAANDVDWLLEAAEQAPVNNEMYAEAAAQLDPRRGYPAYAKLVEKAAGKCHQPEMMLRLLELGGERAVADFVEIFYGRGWQTLLNPPPPPAVPKRKFRPLNDTPRPTPMERFLRFQHQSLKLVADKFGEKSHPILRALIRHERFESLSWSSTRELVLNAEKLLPPMAQKVEDFLELEHKLDPVAFDLAMADAKGNPPMDGDKIVRALREFQVWLKLWERDNR